MKVLSIQGMCDITRGWFPELSFFSKASKWSKVWTSVQGEIRPATVKTSTANVTYHILERLPGSLQVVQVGGAALHRRVVQLLERRPAEQAVALSEATATTSAKTIHACCFTWSLMEEQWADQAMNMTRTLNYLNFFHIWTLKSWRVWQPSSVCRGWDGRGSESGSKFRTCLPWGAWGQESRAAPLA